MAPFSPFPRAHPRGKNCGGTPKKQVLYSPSYNPLGLGPPRAQEGTWVRTMLLICRKNDEYEIPAAARNGGGPIRAGPPREGAALYCVSPVLCAFSCEPACVREQP